MLKAWRYRKRRQRLEPKRTTRIGSRYVVSYLVSAQYASMQARKPMRYRNGRVS